MRRHAWRGQEGEPAVTHPVLLIHLPRVGVCIGVMLRVVVTVDACNLVVLIFRLQRKIPAKH